MFFPFLEREKIKRESYKQLLLEPCNCQSSIATVKLASNATNFVVKLQTYRHFISMCTEYKCVEMLVLIVYIFYRKIHYLTGECCNI